ncbi:MAG: type II toxin-antitoxin system VapC family toxin [Sphingomicrobium sp.]
MSLLLDTHAILWLATGDPKLPASVREQITTHPGDLVVSVVSAWEYSAKRGKFPDQLRKPFAALLLPEYRRLDLEFETHAHAEQLPPIHRDPFDRMLIAQALDLALTLVTADRTIRSYPVPTLW